MLLTFFFSFVMYLGNGHVSHGQLEFKTSAACEQIRLAFVQQPNFVVGKACKERRRV